MELLLLSQVNVDSPLPTFFELYVQGLLNDSLRAAIRLALGMLVQRIGARMPAAVPLVHWQTEIDLVLQMWLQGRFLTHFDSTMTENFFGMKRVSWRGAGGSRAGGAIQIRSAAASSPQLASTVTADAGGGGAPLSMDGSSATAAAISTEGGLSAPSFEPTSAAVGLTSAAAPQETLRASTTTWSMATGGLLSSEHELSPMTKKQRLVTWLLVTLWPYTQDKLREANDFLNNDADADVVALRQSFRRRYPKLSKVLLHPILAKRGLPLLLSLIELSTLILYVSFAVQKSLHFSLDTLLSGTVIRRMTFRDYSYMRDTNSARYRLVQLAQWLLVSVVFAFRIMEWWNVDGRRGDVAASLTQEVLPPAPAPEKVAAIIELPPPGHCPVCRRPIVNPCVNIISGYTFCYPCLATQVESTQRCPVTGLPTSAMHIRRIYED